MFKRLADWLDHRTGYRKLMELMLLEHIPGGAKWRYVWGSCLAFVFLLQVITGLLLMTAYSPGNSTAWGSVYFIQYEMEFGWLIRGLHHFGSQTMVVLLGIHMLQVVIAGAHLPPREINWWLGLLLMALILGLSLTGYLLPWDQKGYWATQVATSIAGSLPEVGGFVRRTVVGGPEYGHATLSRFYTLHVGILPPLIVLLLVAHIAVFRRHGVTAPKDARGEGLFWPDQAFRDMAACIGIFALLLGLVIWGGHGNPVPHSAFHRPQGEQVKEPPPDPGVWDHLALAGRDGRGANLDAPADPGQAYPARPEWYFLFLFQLLKYFDRDQAIWGTVIIPNGVGLLLFLLPLLGHGRMRAFGHAVGVLFVVALLTAIGTLTCLALADDTVDPVNRKLLEMIGLMALPLTAGVFLIYLGLLAVLNRESSARRRVSIVGGALLALLLSASGLSIYGALSGTVPEPLSAVVEGRMTSEELDPTNARQKNIEGFHHEMEKAAKAAKRAVELAPDGIPAEGAVLLLQRDPLTQGPRLFKQSCGVCHSWGLDARTGLDDFHTNAKEKPAFKGADLKGWGTKDWILGLLREPDHARFFGNTPFKEGTMVGWAVEASDKDKATFEPIAEWLATHPRTPPKEGAPHFPGYQAFAKSCQRCHTFAGEGGTSEGSRGPDFTAYGSADWLRLMITDPHDPLRYARKNENAMPLFRDKESVSWSGQLQQLERLREALIQKDLKEVPEVDPKANPEERKEAEAARKRALAANARLRERVLQATEVTHLSEVDRELIIRWMTGDHRVVFGGNPIKGARKR